MFKAFNKLLEQIKFVKISKKTTIINFYIKVQAKFSFIHGDFEDALV
jgi:hypothetical protein